MTRNLSHLFDSGEDVEPNPAAKFATKLARIREDQLQRIGGSMKTNVSRSALIDTLTTNRNKHREYFEKAVEGFKAHALKTFEEHITALKANKMPPAYINFIIPTDQTKDYDRVLGLLARSTDDTVELGEQDYARYVLDQWDWKKQWLASTKNYTNVRPEDDDTGDE